MFQKTENVVQFILGFVSSSFFRSILCILLFGSFRVEFIILPEIPFRELHIDANASHCYEYTMVAARSEREKRCIRLFRMEVASAHDAAAAVAAHAIFYQIEFSLHPHMDTQFLLHINDFAAIFEV